jgi:hypothetical protein
MIKKTKNSVIENNYLGDEPTVTRGSSAIDMINAYNWFNYFYTTEDAKSFILEYLKNQKMDDKLVSSIENTNDQRLNNVGWNCKLLLSGNDLPIDIHSKMLHSIHTLAAQSTKVEEKTTVAPNVQTYIENKANNIISELEQQLDILSKTGVCDFKVDSYFRTMALKAHVAKNIVAHYKPLYSEIFDVLNGSDPELKYAYRLWKKKTLKAYLNFIEEIIRSAEMYCAIAVQTRKPRKKKVKPVSVVVSKVQFKQEDTELNIKSIKTTEIVGANQLWLFNTKYRTLTVLNSMSHAGLGVKGTTVTGFDEKTSITKKIRKPKNVLTPILDSGKIQLRKIMDTIKCKPKTATGRINSDTIILRAIK